MKSTKVFNWVVGIVTWIIGTIGIGYILMTTYTMWSLIKVGFVAALISLIFELICICVSFTIGYIVFSHVGNKTPKQA